MSLCEKCTTLNPISVCTDEIVIGIVAGHNQTYHVYFTSLSTGLIQHFTAESDDSGLLTLNASEGGFEFMTNHLYELFVSATGYYNSELTIGSTTAYCFQVSFHEIYHYSFVSQTLTIAQ